MMFSPDARLEALDAASGGAAGLARSIVPGTLILLFAFYCSLVAILRLEGRPWLWSLLLLLSATALFVNFGRALWMVAAIGTAVAGLLMGPRVAVRLLLVGAICSLLLTFSLEVIKPEILSAAIDRLVSVEREGGMHTSFGWRLTENQYAWAKIEANPIAGIGLGGEYKPTLVPMSTFSEQTRYVHNAYLYILLKMGAIGLLLVLLNHFLLFRSAARFQALQARGSAPRVAISALLIAVPLLSFTQPELFSASTVAALAVLTPIALRVRIPVRDVPRVSPAPIVRDSRG
jgi:O-antigen ligase